MIDLCGITGACLITGGVAWVYPPAGLIVGGALLLTGAILASAKQQKDKS